MYEMLRKLASRPVPYSLMTIKDLWTRPHIARQMLAYHLDQDNHLASRPVAVIREIVDWLDGELVIEERLMDGFWSESDYVGIHRTWVYPDQAISLDHYAIVEPTGHWQILNWMQYFSSERLVRELGDAGYAIRSLTGSLAGAELTRESSEIGVIAELSPRSQ